MAAKKTTRKKVVGTRAAKAESFWDRKAVSMKRLRQAVEDLKYDPEKIAKAYDAAEIDREEREDQAPTAAEMKTFAAFQEHKSKSRWRSDLKSIHGEETPYAKIEARMNRCFMASMK